MISRRCAILVAGHSYIWHTHPGKVLWALPGALLGYLVVEEGLPLAGVVALYPDIFLSL